MTATTRITVVETIRSLGFPIVACMAIAWYVNEQQEVSNRRFDQQQAFITTVLTSKLEESNAVLRLLNETFLRMVAEQRETRAVLRDVQGGLDQ